MVTTLVYNIVATGMSPIDARFVRPGIDYSVTLSLLTSLYDSLNNDYDTV